MTWTLELLDACLKHGLTTIKAPHESQRRHLSCTTLEICGNCPLLDGTCTTKRKDPVLLALIQTHYPELLI